MKIGPMGDALTQTELEVLRRISDGQKAYVIEKEMHMTTYGVQGVIKRIQFKLGAVSQPNMVKIACDKKLI